MNMIRGFISENGGNIRSVLEHGAIWVMSEGAKEYIKSLQKKTGMKLYQSFKNLLTALGIIAFLWFLCSGCAADRSRGSMNKGYVGVGASHAPGMRR